MPDNPLTLEQFGQRIKSAHPEYGDMADAEVGQKVLAKYPQYKDMVQSAPAPPTATIGSNEPQGVQEGIVHYLRQLEGDVKYGTGQTFAGKLLKVMGAQGTDVGAQANMSQSLKPSSPLTGSLKAVEGAASGDVKQTLSGLGEATTLPSMVLGGPAAKAGAEAIPSAKYAGKIIGEVEQAHGALPVNPSLPGSIALEAQRVGRLTKQTVPGPIRGFLERVSSQAQEPLSLEEARRIYSAASSKLSPDEVSKLTGAMKYRLASFTDKLGQAIAETLAPTGQADRFMSALNEYHRAKQLQAGLKYAGATAAAGVGAKLTYDAAGKLIGSR